MKENKKKLVLIPSAYNSKVMGDVSNFIKYYKNDFDLYVIYDKKSKIIDDVNFINYKDNYAKYLKLTADYIIDAGSINGKTYVNNKQKRISVWHGIPYKNMFIDLDKANILEALNYNYGMDLMISPSKFYSENFLRNSMLYEGEILETAVSRTDDLYLTNEEKEHLKEELKLPKDKKIVLYAPTYREKGSFKLPFDSKKIIAELNENTNSEWVLVTKLHYLNKLKDKNTNIFNLTKYSNVNNLLAICDLLITDYSSLMFDYSILDKPALFYQYDKKEYEKDRGFMFKLEDYVDKKYIITNENDLLKSFKNINNIKNLTKIRNTFYPHQVENSTKLLVDKLQLDVSSRKTKDIIFLVNTLNEIGGVHNFILNLSKEFKEKYNSRIFVFGINEFSKENESTQIFDKENLIDIKLGYDSSKTNIESILKNTDGFIISCQFSAHKTFQHLLKNKNSILMFHGDTKDIVNKNLYKWHLDSLNKHKLYNYKSLVLLTKENKNVLDEVLSNEIKNKTINIENSFNYNDSKNYYQKNGEFVFVSRLAGDKNIFPVIDIFSSTLLNKNYKVHIYGDGALKNEFENKINENNLNEKIIMHGYSNDKDEIYKNKQGLILTSLSEGFPLIILEAINYGIPVYLYNSYTACKEFENLNNIKLIETSNIDKFVSELNKNIKIDNQEFEVLRKTFSNETIVNKWIELFNEIENINEVKPSLVVYSKLKVKNLMINVKKKSKKVVKKLLKNIININTKWFTDIILNIEYYLYTLKNLFKKKSNPLVTFVVPFYNKLSTIEALLKSIEKGKYSNYEVLVINDGSNENPEDICKKYKNVKYFYKENEGTGTTRNFGINHAKGKYIFFIDPDDTLCKGTIRYLVDYAEKHKLNLVSGLCRRVFVSTGKINFWYKKIYKKNYINKLNNRTVIINDTNSTAKLYNLEFLKNSNIKFEPGLYEDKLFMSKIYNYYDNIGIVKYMVYNWLVYDDGSSVTTSFNFNNVKERIDRINTIFNLVRENQKVAYFSSFINHDLTLFAKKYLKYNENDRKKIYNLYREFFLKNKEYFLETNINSIYKIYLFNCFLDDDFERFDLISTCIYYVFINE